MNFPRCIIVLGPTAVGKSNLIYSNFSNEDIRVISADSMQIYRNFDVATATPPKQILRDVPHEAVNERDPSSNYSVSEFLEIADRGLKEARDNNEVPIILGGTALYLKAFLFGLDDLPSPNPEFRDRMRQKAEDSEQGALHDELKEIDPEAASNIHPNDTKRIIRALEIYHETGTTKSELTSGTNSLREHINPLIIGLQRPRPELRGRIRERTDRMIDRGLVEEVEQLREQWDLDKTIKQAIGFEAVTNYLENGFQMDEVKERIAQRTNQLVKKQMTWFRRFPVDFWYHPEHQSKELIDSVGKAIKRTG